MKDIFDNNVPSEKIDELEKIIGLQISGMIKVSYETYQDHLDYLNEVGLEKYDDLTSFFKYSYGNILLIFNNGVEYSFGSAEDLNSIILCCEKDISGNKRKAYVLEDTDVLEKTSVMDFDNDFRSVLNKTIISINILTSKKMNSKQQGLPSEIGLEFVFEDKTKLILSHNLTRNSFVFAVLTEDDIIPEDVIVKRTIGQQSIE